MGLVARMYVHTYVWDDARPHIPSRAGSGRLCRESPVSWVQKGRPSRGKNLSSSSCSLHNNHPRSGSHPLPLPFYPLRPLGGWMARGRYPIGSGDNDDLHARCGCEVANFRADDLSFAYANLTRTASSPQRIPGRTVASPSSPGPPQRQVRAGINLPG